MYIYTWGVILALHVHNMSTFTRHIGAGLGGRRREKERKEKK
jgi:hypothetical protein